MKRKVFKLRPSPNEETRLIREEHERRRKLRIQQVREQQRYIALQIRQEVERRRQRALQQLGEELKQDWEQQQREKLETLQRLYQDSLQLLGEGHRSAKENEPDWAAIAQKEEENHTKAEERYREALKELKSQKRRDHEVQTQVIYARKKALQTEKERSAKVASLPPPRPNPIQLMDLKPPHVVRKSDVSAFAFTHYHMPESTVDRDEGTQQPNAHEVAELEVRRLQHFEKDEKRRREEQLEKARLRGKQALRKEQLMQDRERLLVELEHMQQTDLLRRRQQVSLMPPQIFQPLYKRHEMKEDLQREMEFAFEDMYTGERRIKGDLVVHLMPEPLPDLSTNSQEQDLDVTMDEVCTLETENTQPDIEQEAESTERDTYYNVDQNKPAPRRALKKLLDRIRSQRNQWTDHSSRDAEADSPTAPPQPEQDTTIDTGSLTSDEKDKIPLNELLQPFHSPPALDTTEVCTTAETRLPEVPANRLNAFEEECRKKEDELEREKQQQLFLLQELDEQKNKLEELLLEAQQEREALQAAVDQQSPASQAVGPQHHVTSVISGSSTNRVPPSGEDDHTRRIRQYQQQLVTQDRLHQRSVEVARQRLENYQRALRLRYNMSSSPMLSAALAPGCVRPSLQSAVHPTAPLQCPTPTDIPAKSQTSIISSRNVVDSPPNLPFSFSVGSKFLQDVVKTRSNSARNQRPDATAWMTDNIMERVTEHLPQSVRPILYNIEPMPDKLYPIQPSADIPPPPVGPVQSISPSFTAHLIPCHADQSVTLHRSKDDDLESQRLEMKSMSSGENDLERQKLELGSPDSTENELESQQRDLKEAKRRLLKPREQERQQAEQKHKQEMQMEQMRRQKEALQALLHSDAQPVVEAEGDVQVSEHTKQTRLKLLASLLRSIEESNGGTLPHLEEAQEKDGSPRLSLFTQDSIVQATGTNGPDPVAAVPGPLHPHRAPKPPVTRVKLATMKMMPEQHELSVIQEVETPVDSSLVTGPEDSAAVASHIVDSGGVWDLQEESEWSAASEKVLLQSDESPAGSVKSLGCFNNLTCRTPLLTGAGTFPGMSKSEHVVRIISPLSSDSGRGADFSGPTGTNYRSYRESPQGSADSDNLSSTTISTGSYITTDPEQNIADKSPPVRRSELGPEADLLDTSSPSGLSCRLRKNSGAGLPGLAVNSLFNDSSIQRIIDRYTKELDISLSTVGRTGLHQSSSQETPNSSVSLVPEGSVATERSSTVLQSSPSDPAGTQSSSQESNITAGPVLELEGEEMSVVADPEPNSFRPLIGQLADESSCMSDRRESAMVRLVGHPSAHSSMIGQLHSLLPSSLDQGGWDSTLSQMIRRLSHQSSSDWLSGGHFNVGQMIDPMRLEQSTTWLDGGQEESQMRPLVGELDVDQISRNSGDRTCVDLSVSNDPSVPLYQVLHPEASSHRSSSTGVNPQTPQNQTNPMDLGRTEESFHPLLAEVTHNETAEPSMTFHFPEHEVPNSSPEQSASRQSYGSTPVDDSISQSNGTVESELSPEHLRTQEQSVCPTALHESFSQLAISQCLPHESVLCVSPTKMTDVDRTALTQSHVSMCDVPAGPMLEEEETDRICIDRDSVPCRDVRPKELKSEDVSSFWNEALQELGGEKGILEQSVITLASLTDTTQETTLTEEDDFRENKHVIEREMGQKQMEESESTSLPDEMSSKLPPVMFLEFHWGPSRDLQEEVYQQKRRVLHQKSSQRVEEIKAKGALSQIQPENTQVLPAAREPQPYSSKAKTSSGPQPKDPKTHMGPAHSMKQKKRQPPGSEYRLKKLEEAKICTMEQRKRDVTEMHQRTQRLYEQLEEVKHQKTLRSRQEACAKNRIKAKEFHKKTLEKLRAKQTRQ